MEIPNFLDGVFQLAMYHTSFQRVNTGCLEVYGSELPTQITNDDHTMECFIFIPSYPVRPNGGFLG